MDQTLALAVAEKPARSAVEAAHRPKPVGTAPGNARGGVVNGARDELAIRQGREDAALRCGTATAQRKAGEAPLPARPVNGAGNPRRESEFACLGEGPAVPRRDFFPGQRGDLLQSETAQRIGQDIPAPIGAVSVPVNWKIIEPDFMRRAARLGKTAAEHEVPETELFGDEEHRFLEGRLRAVGKNLRKAHGPLVAHVVPSPVGSVPLFWLILYAFAWEAYQQRFGIDTSCFPSPLFHAAGCQCRFRSLDRQLAHYRRTSLTSPIVRCNIPSPSQIFQGFSCVAVP